MTERGSSTAQTESLLQQGIAVAKRGAHAEARRIFMDVAALDPRHEDVWLWLAVISQDPDERMEHITRALTINPQSERAREALRWARRQQNSNPPILPWVRRQPSASRTSVARSREGTPVPRPSRPAQTYRAVRRWRRPSGREVLNVVAMVIILLVSAALLYGGMKAWARFSAAESVSIPANAARMEMLWPVVLRAWDDGNWRHATALLHRARELDPDNEAVQERLAGVYLFQGMAYAARDNYALAYDYFDATLQLYPDHPEAKHERWRLQSYDAALRAFQRAEWDEVIRLLTPLHQNDSEYKHTRHFLYFAHYYRGKLAEENGDWLGGLNGYEAALEIAEWKEARADYERLYRIIYPPRKWVEVDVSEQRMRVYEDDELLYDWVCSTGEADRPTRYGHFTVQSKLESAYSGVWGLTMPWWLGIYWAGGSENGIHALPIRDSDGGTMWAGLLGRRVSYGCIILDNWEAKTLYDWAEIGTEVIVKQ